MSSSARVYPYSVFDLEEGARRVAVLAQDRAFMRAMRKAHPELCPPPILALPEREEPEQPTVVPDPPASIAAYPEWDIPDAAPYDEMPESFDPLRWRRIVHEVAAKHQVSLSTLRGKRRSKWIVIARHEAFFRLSEETTFSLPKIGDLMGGFDHTTVLYGIAAHKKRMRA